MNLEEIDESKLNQLIMMEEFKLWDLKRNNVPQDILNQTREKIKQLIEAKIEKVKEGSFRAFRQR